MKAHVRYGSLFTVLIAAATGAWGAAAPDAVNVTLDPAVRHQTIRGWGSASARPPWASPLLRKAVVREAVNELGLTRLRLGLPSDNRSDTIPWEQSNDDWDPLHINWPAFNTVDMDQRVTEMVLPFKQAVEASRGQAETGMLPVTVPSKAVMTVYAHIAANQPPTVTDFKAT
jgi:hypothetical protein